MSDLEQLALIKSQTLARIADARLGVADSVSTATSQNVNSVP
jgi:hypothetical protein